MSDMSHKGGCYCGALQFELSAKPVMKAQCHCRECQYFSGGGPNYFMVVPDQGFTYTKGTPATFAREDLPAPVTREFCGACGTHITSRRIGLPMAIIKVGTLDDPAIFKAPKLAIYLKDKQPFHVIPKGMPCFEEMMQS